jgi:RNA polymerase sigma-70 factor (ECF subfamily)
LHLLCGLGIQEIADAFFTTRHVIYKRLERAKERLKINRIKIQSPSPEELGNRMENVLTIVYLLFSEGYFSSTHNRSVRHSLCAEAMRLNHLLIENRVTNTPAAHALLALMCFHTSRFDARQATESEFIPYDEQDDSLWDKRLIAKGVFHLNIAAAGKTITKFHLEAGIAYWHTLKGDTQMKWVNILDLYDRLLDLTYSPTAALNRAYALAKVKGRELAIAEVERLQLTDNPSYHALLTFLYDAADDKNSSRCFNGSGQPRDCWQADHISRVV